MNSWYDADVLEPMKLKPEDLAEMRDRYFEPKGYWATSRIERVIGAAEIRPGDLILDLGCARATFSFHAMKVGGRPISLDRDPIALFEGREGARIIGGRELVPVCGDALQLPFADNFFDIIINADFIEHTPDDVKQRLFNEMFRVLKPGGRGVVYTPNLARVEWELFGERMKYRIGLRREKVPRWQDFVDPDHFGLTTPGHAQQLLDRAGFQTRPVYYDHHIPLVSRIPVVGALTRGRWPAHFSERFLIHVTKP